MFGPCRYAWIPLAQRTDLIEFARQAELDMVTLQSCVQHVMVTNRPIPEVQTRDIVLKGQPPELNLCAPRFVYSLYVETISLSFAGADLNGREVDQWFTAGRVLTATPRGSNSLEFLCNATMVMDNSVTSF